MHDLLVLPGLAVASNHGKEIMLARRLTLDLTCSVFK